MLGVFNNYHDIIGMIALLLAMTCLAGGIVYQVAMLVWRLGFRGRFPVGQKVKIIRAEEDKRLNQYVGCYGIVTDRADDRGFVRVKLEVAHDGIPFIVEFASVFYHATELEPVKAYPHNPEHRRYVNSRWGE
jgi:hypothetical protein